MLNNTSVLRKLWKIHFLTSWQSSLETLDTLSHTVVSCRWWLLPRDGLNSDHDESWLANASPRPWRSSLCHKDEGVDRCCTWMRRRFSYQSLTSDIWESSNRTMVTFSSFLPLLRPRLHEDDVKTKRKVRGQRIAMTIWYDPEQSIRIWCLHEDDSLSFPYRLQKFPLFLSSSYRLQKFADTDRLRVNRRPIRKDFFPDRYDFVPIVFTSSSCKRGLNLSCTCFLAFLQILYLYNVYIMSCIFH